MATTLPSSDIPFYLGVMGIGFIISIAVGACIGIIATNQMAATSLSLPVMLLFSFMPMLAMFNDKIEKIAAVFYTQQIREILGSMSFDGMKTENLLVFVVNALLAVSLFFVAFKRKGLE